MTKQHIVLLGINVYSFSAFDSRPMKKNLRNKELLLFETTKVFASKLFAKFDFFLFFFPLKLQFIEVRAVVFSVSTAKRESIQPNERQSNLKVFFWTFKPSQTNNNNN